MSARPLRVGDRVKTGDGLHGTVVVDIDAAEASEGFSADDRIYLRTGLMVLAEEIGLVHYADREDAMLIREA